MSDKQKRPAHITKAMKEIRSFARSEMAKTEIVQFRVDQDDFELLVQAATECQMPMGSMVRQWALERLAGNKSDHKSKAEKGIYVAESSVSSLAETNRADKRMGEMVRLRRDLLTLKKRMDILEAKVTQGQQLT